MSCINIFSFVYSVSQRYFGVYRSASFFLIAYNFPLYDYTLVHLTFLLRDM